MRIPMHSNIMKTQTFDFMKQGRISSQKYLKSTFLRFIHKILHNVFFFLKRYFFLDIFDVKIPILSKTYMNANIIKTTFFLKVMEGHIW